MGVQFTGVLIGCQVNINSVKKREIRHGRDNVDFKLHNLVNVLKSSVPQTE